MKPIIVTNPIYADLPTVAAMLSVSESTVQKLVRETDFPKPRKISSNRVGWLVREVTEWAELRPVSDLPPPPNCGSRQSPAMSAS